MTHAPGGRPADPEDGAPAEDEDEAPTGPVRDDLFGEITVLLNDEEGWVEVLGDAIPPAALDRAAGARTDAHVPIGTRKGADLTMTVDGDAVRLAPGKGRLSRRSYAVDVTRDGVAYRLVPDSLDGSRLLKNGKHIGDFSSGGDGRVLAGWKKGADVSPADASVGYALAAAFGTGGQPMWMMAVEAVSELIPGGR
ncbi:hypothetical protein ABZ543_22755 [Streptomyces roseifaciens]